MPEAKTELFDEEITEGEPLIPTKPATFRTDQALRKAIDRGESTVSLARLFPEEAQSQAITNQRTRVLALAAQPSVLSTYLRSVTERPLRPEDAVRWAQETENVDLDSWARNQSTGPPNGFTGAHVTLPTPLGTAEDEDERVRNMLLGTSALMMLGMVIGRGKGRGRGKSPKGVLAAEQVSRSLLKRAQTSYDQAFTMATRAPTNPAFQNRLANAAQKLSESKARLAKTEIQPGKISEMVEEPNVPQELIERMSDSAQRDHIAASVDRVQNPDHMLRFLSKYRPILRRHSGGPEFMKEVLDRLHSRLGNMDLTPDQVGRLTGILDSRRTASLSDAGKTLVEEIRTELRSGFGDLSDPDTKAFMDMLATEEGRIGFMSFLDEGGALVPKSQEGTGMTWANFMRTEREVAIFDRELQWLVNLTDIRATVESKIVFDASTRSNVIMKGLAEEELAAFSYILRGKEIPKEVPWGPLIPEFRVLRGAERAPDGWKEFSGGGIKIAINNPNKPIRPKASDVAKNAALRWRKEVLDPLAKLAGLPEDQFLEFYLPRVYSRKTVRQMAEEGLLEAKSAKKILGEDLIMDPSVLTPGSETVWRALLQRKLPDLALYIQDPRVIAPIYIRGAARKIGFDPVLQEWSRIKTKFTPVKGTSSKEAARLKRVTDHFDRFVMSAVGRHQSIWDKSMTKWLKGMDPESWGQNHGWSRWLMATSFGEFLREPGQRPAARISDFIKGVEFRRKIGWSLSTPIINSFQALQNAYSQSSNPVYALHDFYHGSLLGRGTPLNPRNMHYSAKSQVMHDGFAATGLKADTAVFVGEKPAFERTLDSMLPPMKRKGQSQTIAGIKKIAEPFYEGAGEIFARTEQAQAFRSFTRATLDAERGRMFQEGVGIVRGKPVTDPQVKNLIGFLAARREQFGGRVIRAPMFRDPLGGGLSQFLSYSYRQTGLIGKHIKNAFRGGKRAAEKWKAGDKIGAFNEWNDNVFAPVKMIGTMAAIAMGFKVMGVDFGRGAAQVLGFVPYIDARSLGEGQIGIQDQLTGPFVSDLQRIPDYINRSIAAATSDNPRVQARLGLRVAEMVAHFLPVGEVQAKRIARVLLDPEITDAERIHVLVGYPSEREAVLKFVQSQAAGRRKRWKRGRSRR